MRNVLAQSSLSRVRCRRERECVMPTLSSNFQDFDLGFGAEEGIEVGWKNSHEVAPQAGVFHLTFLSTWVRSRAN